MSWNWTISSQNNWHLCFDYQVMAARKHEYLHAAVDLFSYFFVSLFKSLFMSNIYNILKILININQ